MKGLTSTEAQKRLVQYGENVIESKKGNGPLKVFAGQFRDVMVMILLVGAVISVFLGEVYDALTIIVIVMLNAILGFVQEYRTEKTLEALKNMTAPTAKVMRDGKKSVIPAAEIVPGDAVYLETGDRVPADCVLTEVSGLFSDESMLTGESEPIEKIAGSESDSDNSLNRRCIAYSGTVITGGHAVGYVIATGKKSQMGNISSMINETENSRTPLQKRLGELGKVVAIICIAVCIVVFVAGVLRGEPVFDMLMTGITIAIAAIPEGLPATVTIALALAVSRMLKQKALVNKLHSVETLGCTSVICSDKTGTITENKMTVTHIFTDMREYPVSENGIGNKNAKTDTCAAELFRCAIYCSNAEISSERIGTSHKRVWKASGNPTESAVLIAAAKSGFTKNTVETVEKIAEKPFESSTKKMSVTVKNKNGNVTEYIKGAPDILLRECSEVMTEDGVIAIDNVLRKKLEEQISSFSRRALRVLALAKKEKDKGVILLGLAAMQDPPRKEAVEAIRKCSGAKIKTVMITGDHKETAVAIAKQAGLLKGGKAVTGKELDAMSDAELMHNLDDYTVYARVNPSHKLRLVKAYKQKGHIVTMTGDGVNDAPAVKAADVGVSMGITGTDVTKQAADVILLDDNFATLVNAVEQGRGIYANIRKFVRYLLSSNIGEVITMFLCIIMGLPMVMLPTQLLLVNLVTDGLPAIALGMEPCGKDVMKKAPRKKDESFFADGLLFKIIFRGVLIGLCTLACFTTLLKEGYCLDLARTGALMTLITSQLVHVFECKSETKGIFGINYFDNLKLIGAVMISFAVLMAAVFLPFVQRIFSTVSLGREPLLISLGFALAVPVISGIGMAFSRKNKH